MPQLMGGAPVSSVLETPYDSEIVGRHGCHGRTIKAMCASEPRDFIQIADAPFRVLAAKALVKRHVPLTGMFSAFTERPVQDETTIGL